MKIVSEPIDYQSKVVADENAYANGCTCYGHCDKAPPVKTRILGH